MVRRTYAIIVAAGNGHRFGSPLPKQFCMLGDMPVLGHTIGNLRSALPAGSKIVLVLHPDYFGTWRETAERHGCPREDVLAGGGASRAESVANALDVIHPEADSIVLIHDGVRPFVSGDIIEGLYAALEKGAACAIPTVGLTDSIRETAASGISHATDRSRFRAVQTPQAFQSDALVKAYRHASESGFERFTDDASVLEDYMPEADIRLTSGSPYNIKITNPLDLKIAEALL